MKIKITPQEIYSEYEQGKQYNSSINLYENVKINENFYNGKQWEGVNAPDLDKPVFNVIKRVINLQVAQLNTDDIAISLNPFNADAGIDDEIIIKAVSTEIERAIEYAQIKNKNRKILRNAAVDGDAALYLFHNTKKTSGQAVTGLIDAEILDNTNIIFGNPYSADVQEQPYLLILQRKDKEQVKTMAKENGATQDEIDSIKADSEADLFNDENVSNLVSVITKFWKDENGIVNAVQTTANVTLKQPWKTEYQYYPITYMSWEDIKNSYHGQSAVTERIPNQKFINKIFAMGMYYTKMNAFPKMIYDRTRLPNGITNKIGEAIAIDGTIDESVYSVIKNPDMSNQVMELAEKTMKYTQEYMGASDATLGNLKPDNATAIIALQQSSNAPLEITRNEFYRFIEDMVLIMLDIMRVNYGVRTIYMKESGNEKTISDGEEMPSSVQVDFSNIGALAYNVNIEVGAGSYWSEIMQMQTLDALLANGVIVDAVDYLEGVPDKYIRNKDAMIASVKKQKAQQEMMQQAATQPPINEAIPPQQSDTQLSL